jgi:hypothetical protein
MKPTPKPDALQRYGADLSDFAYSQERVRQMLADAHEHYEAQIRPLSGMAMPCGALPPVFSDARIDAMASAGKVALLTAKVADLSALLAKESTRNDTLVDAMKDAARTLEGAHLSQDGQEVAYTVAKGLRRAAE